MSSTKHISTIKSIAEYDKKIMDLEHLVNLKKQQMKKDYETLLKNVNLNPHLQAGIHEYQEYFKKDMNKKNNQINALKNILNSLDKDNVADRNDIKREIKLIEKEIYYTS